MTPSDDEAGHVYIDGHWIRIFGSVFAQKQNLFSDIFFPMTEQC